MIGLPDFNFFVISSKRASQVFGTTRTAVIEELLSKAVILLLATGFGFSEEMTVTVGLGSSGFGLTAVGFGLTSGLVAGASGLVAGVGRGAGAVTRGVVRPFALGLN